MLCSRAMKDSRTQDKRICYVCGSEKTCHDGKGYPNWYLNPPTILRICQLCYMRYIVDRAHKRALRRKSSVKSNPRRFRFKDKYLRLSKNPRSGVCQQCGRIGGKTDIHHEKYDKLNPLAYTIELCAVCHGKRTWKNMGIDRLYSPRNTKHQ